MCGIVGFIGKKGNTYNADKIKYLLHMNQSRGKDATGIWTKEEGVQKSVKEAEDFIVDDTIKWTPSNMIIGHVRQSSSGSKTLDNAHPHDYPEVVLAHNGTLRYLSDLASKYKIDNYTTYTDSQLLTKIINDTKSTKVLTDIVGSAALLFVNKAQNELITFRKEANGTDERPLYYSEYNNPNNPKESGIYFSSVRKSLVIIGCKNADIKEVPAANCLIFKDGELKNTVPIKIRKETTSYSRHNSNYGHGCSNHSSYGTPNYNSFEGNWARVRNDVSLDDDSHSLIPGEWVYVKRCSYRAFNTNSYYSVDVVTEQGVEYENVKASSIFDNSSYTTFELSGQFVFMYNIVVNPNSDVYIFSKGEVVKPELISWNKKHIEFRSKWTNKIHNVGFELIRKAVSDETSLYHIDNINKYMEDSDDYCLEKLKELNKGNKQPEMIKYVGKSDLTKLIVEENSIEELTEEILQEIDDAVETKSKNSFEYLLNEILINSNKNTYSSSHEEIRKYQENIQKHIVDIIQLKLLVS
jgi:predicted glutamine amidotransferase